MATTRDDGAYEEVIRGRMQMMRDRQNADLMERQRENERRRQVFEENSRAFDDARRREQNGNPDGNISSFSAYNDENGQTVRYNGEGGREPTSWTSRTGNRPLSWNDAAMQQQMLANQSVFDRISGSTKSARKSERDRQNMQNNVLATMMALAAEDGNGGMGPPESLSEINSILGNRNLEITGYTYNDKGNMDIIGRRNGGGNEVLASYDPMSQLSTFAGAPGIGSAQSKRVYDSLISKGLSPESIYAKTKYRLPEPADGGWKGDIERGKLENQKFQIESRERMQGMRSAREKIDTEKLAAMKDDIADLQKKVDDAGDKASNEDVAMLRRMKALHRSYVWGDSLDQQEQPGAAQSEGVKGADGKTYTPEQVSGARNEIEKRSQQSAVDGRIQNERMDGVFRTGTLRGAGMGFGNGSMYYNGGRYKAGDTVRIGGEDYVWRGGNTERASFVPKREWDKQQTAKGGPVEQRENVPEQSMTEDEIAETELEGKVADKPNVPGMKKSSQVSDEEKLAAKKLKQSNKAIDPNMRDTDVARKYPEEVRAIMSRESMTDGDMNEPPTNEERVEAISQLGLQDVSKYGQIEKFENDIAKRISDNRRDKMRALAAESGTITREDADAVKARQDAQVAAASKEMKDAETRRVSDFLDALHTNVSQGKVLARSKKDADAATARRVKPTLDALAENVRAGKEIARRQAEVVARNKRETDATNARKARREEERTDRITEIARSQRERREGLERDKADREASARDSSRAKERAEFVKRNSKKLLELYSSGDTDAIRRLAMKQNDGWTDSDLYDIEETTAMLNELFN